MPLTVLDADDYVHRIGRTGRAGNKGLATAFFNSKNNNVAVELYDIIKEHRMFCF